MSCQTKVTQLYGFCEALMAPHGVSANQNTIVTTI